MGRPEKVEYKYRRCRQTQSVTRAFKHMESAERGLKEGDSLMLMHTLCGLVFSAALKETGSKQGRYGKCIVTIRHREGDGSIERSS
mmetsp:Transcript_56175/g.109996  ORF Transcript_56175/g.109996 Transcript_56175/m.109996 type:complete len:86 (-) Transcript_56175:1058-1315(-)